ncbi:hypothetical protein HELRODRAFT_163947 [Helobdella robusta]|uniref:Uncharacterized protein n=1 Tax=Helobdella robusta TaxID=6412 RepID=T1EUN2_HELRO|nr:hypothetical protein HELRODRAFT_163947 [Helobdella robusta]ESN94163.1 hypothetical protein HELRODRAFT_163947 [Helobdella robusta]
MEKSCHPRKEVYHDAGQPEYVPTCKKRKLDEDDCDDFTSKKTNFEKNPPALTSLDIDELLKNLVKTGLIKINSAKSDQVEMLNKTLTGYNKQNSPILSTTTTTTSETSKQLQLKVKSTRVDPRITSNLRKGLLCDICGVKFRHENPFRFLKDRKIRVSAEERLKNHIQEHSLKNSAKHKIYYIKLDEWVKLDCRNVSIDYGEPIVVAATTKKLEEKTGSNLSTKKRKKDEDYKYVKNVHEEEDDDDTKLTEEMYNQIVMKYKRPVAL